MTRSTAVDHGSSKANESRVGSQPKSREAAYDESPLRTVEQLHRALGNRATQGLLRAGGLQAKLRVGAAGDRYEREADRIADQVLRSESLGPIASLGAGRAQRMCSQCQEEEDDLAQPKLRPGATPADARTLTGLPSGQGAPLSGEGRAYFEPRFGHDFSDVRVHAGALAAEASRSIGARAFTVGRDVFFGSGEYAPETNSGRRLLAHELAHVVQQTPLIARRQPVTSTGDGPSAEAADLDAGPTSEQTTENEASVPETDVPEGAGAAETPVPGLIAGDDAGELSAGQMRRAEFLAALRSEVCAAADQALAGTEQTAQGCPWIELSLRFYEHRSAERVERDLVGYVPEAAAATSARDYIALAAARVRQSVAEWVSTGEITGVPAGLPSADKIAALAANGQGPSGVLFKAKSGGPRGDADPVGVQAQLGRGRALSGPVRTRMESAFGRSFSGVRVHNDAGAAQLSNRFNARAFTVGAHVAFGTGEYRPGTLVGDAIIAHELAHVVQQGQGTSTAVAPWANTGVPTSRLESDADRSAAGALQSLWGAPNQSLKTSGRPRLRSGLQLQRCKNETKVATQPKLSKKTVSGPTASDCGGFRWVVQWELDKKTTKGGWVVQKVELPYDVKDCSDKAVDPSKVGGLQPSWYPLWEAWQINKNQKITTYAEGGDVEDDTYGSTGTGSDTKGTVTVKGTAEFYDGLALPSSFKVTNSAPTWILPATNSAPTLSGGTGAISHDLKATWDCCSKDVAATKATKIETT